MYIYQALINAMSAHIIRINLNAIFYTHVEDGPTKTVYVRQLYRTDNFSINTGQITAALIPD